MNYFKKSISLLLLVALTLSITAFSVFADIESIDDAKKVIVDGINNNKSWVSNVVSKEAPTDGSDVNTVSTPDGTVYYIVVSEEDAIKAANNAVELGQVSENIVGLTDNIRADLTTAELALRGFVPTINFLLGIIVTVVSLALGVFTAFDICYITMPVFRNKCEEAKSTGSGPMVKSGQNGKEAKLRFVTDEAVYAVNNCSIENGKNPMAAYIKHRIWAYILVGVAIFMLLTGNISVLTEIALDIVGFIMDALASLT